MYYKIVNYIELVLNDCVDWFITVGNIGSIDKKSIIKYLEENNRLILNNLPNTKYEYIEFRNIVKMLDGDKNIICYDCYVDDDGDINISQINIVNHNSQILKNIKAWCDKNNYDSYYSYNGSLFILDKYGVSNVIVCAKSSNSICIYGSTVNNIDKEKFINDLKKYLNLNNIILDENKFIGGKINDF